MELGVECLLKESSSRRSI